MADQDPPFYEVDSDGTVSTMSYESFDRDEPNAFQISIKLPTYEVRDPTVWFKQIEAVFETHRITSERTRYSYVVQSPQFDVAYTVQDLLDPNPRDQAYTQLKQAFLRRTAQSADRKLNQLLNNVKLGDQTPSALMRHMRHLLAGRTQTR
ncbi:unnamed protein product [Dibothriocephalus latus]|uniref:DUF7041 domain-containing protein n=1 Tax=Dibothriocephalus latus TaxID=60516 RepID=A0A3P7LWB4_DIBLA|nr:unnamed protein product [Dibothriocephalus latus]